MTRLWGQQTFRSGVDEVGKTFQAPADRPIVDAVAAVARERGVGMSRVSLAWVLRHPAVAAPIVGAANSHHLADAGAALDLELSDHEVRCLEESYLPQPPCWY
ncbi:MAG: aldo/keto reductase [Actinomycetota bacterium]|nr:aldo/keto reductase [Actinomycetota bacterium]